MNQQPVSRTISLGDDEQRVVFGIDDLCRHTMIFGSSGSGKTTRAYNPMLADMLGRLQAGAFIIAAKIEAVGEVVEIARRAGRDVLVVQPGSAIGLDLLCGSPDVDAMYFRDTFGRVGDDAKQWVDAAVARMKNALRMLQAAGTQYYTFEHLTSYCFDDTFAAMVRIQAMERLRALDHGADDAWTIREAMSYEDTRYQQFTPDARRAVQFAVSQLLEPLRDVHIAKTFAGRNNLVQMDSVFDGKVIVLHVPRTRFERAAQAIYTLAKRRFFTALENRRADTRLDQERPIVFGIDEYQLCISESDVQSLGIIRSAGCMVLGTTQGVSSLYSVLPKHHVDAALQNFTQKIFFKTDDDDTLAVLERATKHNANKIDTSELFSMNRNQALCHLTVGDDSVDAILTMKPLFITPAPNVGLPTTS
jgi:type IV secretory pathway TraG/TraD family ATPase VirD4